jgi:hypothetical protein
LRTCTTHPTADDAVLSSLFQAGHGVAAEADYLALEHEDKGGRRPAASANRHSSYERAVKIYN